MRRIKATYSRPPRQVHSHASVELRLAFPRLFEDYLSRFLTRSVTLLTTGHRVPKVERLLDAENLHSVKSRILFESIILVSVIEPQI